MKLLLILTLHLYSALAYDVGNGKSVIIPLDKPYGSLQVNDRNITVLPHPVYPDKGFVIIPMDYYEQPNLIHAKYTNDIEQIGLEINVTSSIYPTEILSVDNSKVSPPPEVLQRIADEKAEA